MGPPPAEASARARKIMDTIYNLGADHHGRQTSTGASTSRLLRDVEEVLRMDNGGFVEPGARLIHFCARIDGRPCCADLSETKERMTAAYLNLFTCHAMPTATLSRWTHIEMVCAVLCTGFACRGLFVAALSSGLAADARAEEQAQDIVPVASGAGDDDVVRVHRARLSKVRSWLGSRDTKIHVGCLFFMLRILGSVSYLLMGGADGDKVDEACHRPASALPMRTLVGRVRQTLVDCAAAVCDFTEEASSVRCFLYGIGVSFGDIDGQACMRLVRRYMVGASAGIYRRLFRRFVSFPLALWVVVEPEVPREAKLECAALFGALPGCCQGAFGRRLHRLCPRPVDLLGDLGQAVLKSWLESAQWSVHSCEKQHASCRRLVSGAGPSRSWTQVARERILESARAIHRRRVGVDPAFGVVPSARKGKKRDARAVSLGREPPPPPLSLEGPLHEGETPTPPSAPDWPTQITTRMAVSDALSAAGHALVPAGPLPGAAVATMEVASGAMDRQVCRMPKGRLGGQ